MVNPTTARLRAAAESLRKATAALQATRLREVGR